MEGIVVVQAQDYINVPPRENSHWEHYEIPVELKPLEYQSNA
jgi:hypothetical protein